MSEIKFRFNPIMKTFMREILKVNTESSKNIDEYFDNYQDWLIPINKTRIRTGNLFKADKNKIVIRKKEFQKTNSPFGWIFDEEGDPISIHSNCLIPKEDIFKDTYNSIKIKFAKNFASEKDVAYRIYKCHPELLS